MKFMWKIFFRTRLFFSLFFLAGNIAAKEVSTTRGEIPVYIPADYADSQTYPLLLLLHGYGFDGKVAESIWGFTEIIDKYKFIYATPTGTIDSTNSPFWNATNACCNFYGSTADDLSFLYRLIEAIKADYNIDANRVYVVGDSNGGFMALELAYRFPEIITAAVSSAGASHFETRRPPKAGVHVLQVQGTNDTSILYGGGTIQGAIYPGLEASTNQWASYNKCSEIDAEIDYKDLMPKILGHETEVKVFNKGCLREGSAESWTIEGGGHGLGRPVLISNTEEVVDWLLTKAKFGWPSKYNGITPPSYLGLNFNNIGSFNERDGIIYTCIRALQNGELSEINGNSRFDIGFEISSSEQGKIRVIKSRRFNSKNVLNKSSESPDCSGSFEITTGIYSDIILLGKDILQIKFKLTDINVLELTLLSIDVIENP